MSASATVLPEKATHQQTRAFNQQLVLRALHGGSCGHDHLGLRVAGPVISDISMGSASDATMTSPPRPIQISIAQQI